MCLAIAQLVERWTVALLLSIGHWFDSGSRDFLHPVFTYKDFCTPTQLTLILISYMLHGCDFSLTVERFWSQFLGPNSRSARIGL